MARQCTTACKWQVHATINSLAGAAAAGLQQSCCKRLLLRCSRCRTDLLPQTSAQAPAAAGTRRKTRSRTRCSRPQSCKAQARQGNKPCEVNHLQVRRLRGSIAHMQHGLAAAAALAPALLTHSILKALRRGASGSGPANCMTRTNVPALAVACSSTRMRVKPVEGKPRARLLG